MKSNDAIVDLEKRKAESRAYLRSLSLEDKIARLADLQEQYYSMLRLRERNGGKPIPTEWQKWFAARHG